VWYIPCVLIFVTQVPHVVSSEFHHPYTPPSVCVQSTTDQKRLNFNLAKGCIVISPGVEEQEI